MEKGWQDNICLKILDEPHREGVKESLRMSRFLHEVAPRLRFKETIAYEEGLAMLDEDHITLSLVNACFLHEGRDLESIHGRIIGWTAYLFGHTGYHHWAWAWGPGDVNGGNFGPGELYLVYADPARQTILDSIRWEMLRDAAEDYELLTLLDQAGGDAKAFCRRLVSAAMTYERSPETFFQVRHDLLEALRE